MAEETVETAGVEEQGRFVEVQEELSELHLMALRQAAITPQSVHMTLWFLGDLARVLIARRSLLDAAESDA